MPSLRFLTLSLLSVLLFTSCNKSPTPSGEKLTKVRVGYIGITCEAPVFSAVENGFFKEEGLDVEMMKFEWSQYKDALALGKFDITHHLIMLFLKPIEQGLDVKIGPGIHTGCLRVQTGVNSEIQTLKDLKGKRIGVPGMGTPPFVFANRALGTNGVDPGKDITWKSYPAAELILALEKGEVDAIADSEPIGTLLLSQGKVKNIADQAKDEPFKDEYCCAVVLNGKFFSEHPKEAAAATRALMKGAKWVETNPAAAARMSVEKKYLASNPELNSVAISNLRYLPSVAGGEKAILTAATAMQATKMLLPTTDIPALCQKAHATLEGVTDEWLQTVSVEKLADGQIPPDQNLRLAMELAHDDPIVCSSCCEPNVVVKAQ